MSQDWVVSQDWVARYQNRWLQLERQSQNWAPAKSRVLVRENQAGEVAIHYRDHRLGFRELKLASTALSEGPCHFPRAPIPETAAQPSARRQSCLEIRLRNKEMRAAFLEQHEPKAGDISIVV